VADRGERQRLVFGLILRLGSVTSRDLVEVFGLSHSGASTELARYQRQGFLHREPELGPGPPVFRYRLNKSGEDKARWWVEQGFLHPPGQEHLPGLAPEEFRIRPVLREEPPVQRIRPKLRD